MKRMAITFCNISLWGTLDEQIILSHGNDFLNNSKEMFALTINEHNVLNHIILCHRHGKCVNDICHCNLFNNVRYFIVKYSTSPDLVSAANESNNEDTETQYRSDVTSRRP